MRDVAIRGKWPPQPLQNRSSEKENGNGNETEMQNVPGNFFKNCSEGIGTEVRVGEFLSEAVGDHFK